MSKHDDKHEKHDKKDKKEKKKDRVVVLAELDFGAAVPEEVLQALPALVEATREEEGCRKYRVHVPVDGSGKIMFHEVWENMEALERHAACGHLADFRAIAETCCAGRRLSLWRRIL